MLLSDTDVSGYHQQDHCFKIIKAAASLFAISLPYQTKPLIANLSSLYATMSHQTVAGLPESPAYKKIITKLMFTKQKLKLIC